MKKINIIFMILVLILMIFGIGMAATARVTLNWDGKDTLGNVEASMPVTITVYDVDTGLVLTFGSVSGPVTGYALPDFNVVVPNDTIKVLRVNAKAKDAATPPNESVASSTVSVSIKGLDTIPPSGTVSINSGAASTSSAPVTLTLAATDALGTVTGMKFSNDGITFSTEVPYAVTYAWTLSSGIGTKTVSAKFKDNTGNWSSSFTDTIQVVDVTPPGVPVITITIQ